MFPGIYGPPTDDQIDAAKLYSESRSGRDAYADSYQGALYAAQATLRLWSKNHSKVLAEKALAGSYLPKTNPLPLWVESLRQVLLKSFDLLGNETPLTPEEQMFRLFFDAYGPEGSLHQIFESYALFVRWSHGEDTDFDSALLTAFAERAPLSKERVEALRSVPKGALPGNLLDLWDAISWARGLVVEASNKVPLRQGDLVRQYFHYGVLQTYAENGLGKPKVRDLTDLGIVAGLSTYPENIDYDRYRHQWAANIHRLPDDLDHLAINMELGLSFRMPKR